MDKEQLAQTELLAKKLEEEAIEIAHHICGISGALTDDFPLAQGEMPEQEHHELITTGLLMPIIELVLKSHAIGNEQLQEQCAQKLFALGAMCIAGDGTASSEVIVQRIDSDDEEAIAMMESIGEVKH